jgi:hypothetical protein
MRLGKWLPWSIVCGALLQPVGAQQQTLPTARLVPAPRMAVPGAVDSNVPMLWDLVDGAWRLFAFASWGGIPVQLAGSSVDRMQRLDPVTILDHPGHGIWLESVIAADDGTWYAYYHHEVWADACGRLDRAIPRIGAARSVDRGATWENLGIILEGSPEGYACGSTNAFVLGGVGDVTAVLDPEKQDLFLFFTQYHRAGSAQGVTVARLTWADRDAPRGRAAVWQDGVWLPAIAVGDPEAEQWEYPVGTPLVRASRPWHDGDAAADVFWGPSIHWNTYLERYVMLLNRARDDRFNNEGIYVSYATTLDDPRAWSAPRKIMNGGNWYPQVAGLEAQAGTDKTAGQRARFFLTGRSDHYLVFQK